jgi:hypothetical protein
MNTNHTLVNEVPQFFPWSDYKSDCLQNCSAVRSSYTVKEAVSLATFGSLAAVPWLYTILGRSVCHPVLCLAQHYNGSTSTVPTWFGPCDVILFHMLKIVLKEKKIDKAEYDRVTAGHFGIAVLLCYSCTEMQTDGCSHFIKSDGLHYDRVTSICYSSFATNYNPKHVSSASVFSFQWNLHVCHQKHLLVPW